MHFNKGRKHSLKTRKNMSSAHKGKFRKPLSERFWEKVDKSKDCWIWLASLDSNNRGQFNYKDGKMVRAHRMSWFLTYGEWPNGVLMHQCDNPPCVNPNHLIDGTQLENLQDAQMKGRNNRKFTDEQAIEIIKKYKTGLFSLRKLAKDYGFTYDSTWHIVKSEYYNKLFDNV